MVGVTKFLLGIEHGFCIIKRLIKWEGETGKKSSDLKEGKREKERKREWEREREKEGKKEKGTEKDNQNTPKISITRTWKIS